MAKRKKEQTWREAFRDVHLIGDCGTFMLEYTPTVEHGRPQQIRLEAEDEENAKFEAANILEHGCKPEDLEVEWS